MPAATVHRVLAEQLGPDWRQRFREFDDGPAAAASIGQVHRATWAGRPRRSRSRCSTRAPGRRCWPTSTSWPGSPGCSRCSSARPRRQAAARRAAGPGRRGAGLRAGGGRQQRRSPRRTRTTRRSSCRGWWPARRRCSSPSGSTGTPLAEDHRRRRPRPQRDRAGLPAGRAALLRAGPGRAAARRPAPGQLPAARRRPARRDRLRRGRPAARRAAGADRPADPAGARRRRRGGARRAARRRASSGRTCEIDAEAVLDYLRPMLEPLAHDDFHFTRAWMRAQAARIADPRSAAAQLGRQLNLPPSYLLIHRVTLGSIGVLCQLDADAPYRGDRRTLAARLRHPLTPSTALHAGGPSRPRRHGAARRSGARRRGAAATGGGSRWRTARWRGPVARAARPGRGSGWY